MAELGVCILATDGQRDGTPVTGNGTASPGITIAALNQATPFWVKSTSEGFKAPGDTTVSVPEAVQPYLEVSADGNTWGTSAAKSGVEDVNSRYYLRQIAYAVPNTILQLDVDGGILIDIPQAPAFTAGPVIAEVTASTMRLLASWADPDAGNTVTASRIVNSTGTTPSESDWSGASSFDGDETIGSLEANTTYYAWVRIVDSTGLATVSSRLAFSTTIASNLAPTFKAGESPSVKTRTTDGFTIQMDYSDADGDAITVKAAVNTANSFVDGDYQTITPSWNASTDKWEYSVSGLGAGAARYVRIRLEDAGHTGANGTTSATVSVTTYTETLDQSYEGTMDTAAGIGTSSGEEGDQSFTPGVSGPLSKFAARLYAITTTGTSGLVLEIWSDNAGALGSLLGTSDVLTQFDTPTDAGAPVYKDFVFSTMPILTSATVYHARLRAAAPDAQRYGWRGTTSANYSGGKARNRATTAGTWGDLASSSLADFHFKTYMLV